ncbi:MAG: hypothetical protein AB3N24_00355, partial [Leisingera sp.]
KPRQCGTARDVDGGTSAYCAWAYPFRSAESQGAYAAVLRELAACSEPEGQEGAGSAVNHPDSYELRVFRLGGQTVSLALKDKSGLNETYIFVRVEAAED